MGVKEENKHVEALWKCQLVGMYEKFSARTEIITYLSQKVEEGIFFSFFIFFDNTGREEYMLHQNLCLIS